MRLRNTPFPEHSSEEGGWNKMDIELPLFSDHRIRNVSPGSAFYGGGTNGYIANVTTCDNQQESRETGKKIYMPGGIIIRHLLLLYLDLSYFTLQ